MIFEFNDAQILFGMFEGFKKATPYGGAKKLRLTLPPVRRALGEHLLDSKWSMPYNIVLTKTYLNKTLKCFIVRTFLAQKVLCKSNTFRIKVYSSDKN